MTHRAKVEVFEPASTRSTELASEFTFSSKHCAQTSWKTPIFVDMFAVPLLRNGLHNTVVLLLLVTDDTENTSSSIVA
jgi:hypothetical protein